MTNRQISQKESPGYLLSDAIFLLSPPSHHMSLVLPQDYFSDSDLQEVQMLHATSPSRILIRSSATENIIVAQISFLLNPEIIHQNCSSNSSLSLLSQIYICETM